MAGRGHTGWRGRLDDLGRGLVRPHRQLAAHRRGEDPGRHRRGPGLRRRSAPAGARRGRAAARPNPAPAPAQRHRQGDARQPTARARPAGGRRGGRRGRRSRDAPAARPPHRGGSVPAARRPGKGALRLLVRVLPELGTIDDFDAFVGRARDLGLEIALDLALQCSPDHPWVEEHPEWFTTRADGTIAYAENPPKKYQDIYPLNFDNDPEGIAAEVLRVVRHWIDHGVRIFRVDNPHTKPVNFWQRLLDDIRHTDPDVVFLAEAFTRHAMMHTLAKVGFGQSYTYFTWKNGKDELTGYLTELRDAAAYMRPNVFVNTPDILHAYLQYGGPVAFKIRAVLAAMLSPTWGVYAGYELFEHVSVRPGSEEYLDSEKYQYRPRDW